MTVFENKGRRRYRRSADGRGGGRRSASRGKPIGEFVRLTVKWWDGIPPRPGDGLVTKTGRRYLILAISKAALTCAVVGADHPFKGCVWKWQWASRRRRT